MSRAVRDLGGLVIGCLFGAGFIRGGIFLYAAGMAVTTLDGTPAGRLRAVIRAAIAWGPMVLIGGFYLIRIGMTPWPAPWPDWSTADHIFVFSCLGIFIAGAVYAICNPERGVQDLIAGTTIVAR
jgi:hypothetical protein